MSCVAVIDIGKTNVKLALVDTEGLQEVAVRTLRNRVLPGPPYPYYDTEAHWAFLLDALREFGRSHEVAAISITTHGATAALVDRDGGLVLPILDYEHDGPETLAAEYEAVRPPFAESGSPRLGCGLNLGAQLFWQFRSFPQAREAAQILTYPQYWAFRLCGVAAVEPTSLGCHTDLWSPRAGGFSGLVELMGWTPLMPPVRRAAEVLGPLRPEIAEVTGLAPGTPVLCGIHDSNASLYPHLLRRDGAFSVVSTGTWVICMAIGGADVPLDPARDTLVNVNALGDPVPSARFMGGREYEIVRAGADLSHDTADRTRVLERGVMLLPAVEPGSGPFRGCAARWTVEPANGGERSVALSWYLALMTEACLSAIGAEGPVVVEGPFARNVEFIRMLRAGTGRRVEAAGGNITGTSIGAALLADPPPRAVLAGRETADQAANQRLVVYAEEWRREVDAIGARRTR